VTALGGRIESVRGHGHSTTASDPGRPNVSERRDLAEIVEMVAEFRHRRGSVVTP